MRLKCGFLVRTLLLTVLLYLILIISKNDKSSKHVKDAILQQLPSNHIHKDHNHQNSIYDENANNSDQAEPSNTFLNRKKSKEQNTDFENDNIPKKYDDFNDNLQEQKTKQIEQFNKPNRFGKIISKPEFVPGNEVDLNNLESVDENINFVKQRKMLPKISELLDNLAKEEKVDLLAGTVGSLKYTNYSVKTPTFISGIGNYEPEDECKNVWKNENNGQCGNKVTLNNEEQKLVPEIIKKFGFNLVASDKVPLDRSPKDLRKEECKHWDYPEHLPKSIVILVFYNEGWGPLMRTVHTVIKQTPKNLLSHIVMVDDGSPRAHLKQKLENYISENWPDGLVRLYRNKRREGLIRARIIGAQHAMELNGDILVYLDAHCEPMPNWLPPLVAPIARDKRMSTVPFIDSINGHDYSFSSQGGGDENGHARGAWDWSMLWKRMPLNEKEQRKHKYVTEPYASPAMAGGLFAIDKHYFKSIGFYDPGLEIWGGENFEISYKIWMCHGQVLFVPCSRVGHIYRLEGWSGNPPPEYVPSNPSLRNYMRVVEVWWDDFKKYFYTTRPETIGLDYGDISVQKQFRIDNKCKTFEWFMDNIAPDLLKFHPLPPLNLMWGEMRALNSEKCLDGMGRKNGNGEMAMYGCHKQGGNQLFRLTKGYQLAQYDSCVTVYKQDVHWKTSIRPGSKLTLFQCGQNEYNDWKWDAQNKHIIHTKSSLCVTRSETDNDVTLEECDNMLASTGSLMQQWEFNEVHSH